MAGKGKEQFSALFFAYLYLVEKNLIQWDDVQEILNWSKRNGLLENIVYVESEIDKYGNMIQESCAERLEMRPSNENLRCRTLWSERIFVVKTEKIW